eukprot:TRINITY_DN3266_c0_g1_i6.p1 TRINITY_DN3266_c0_g1~~TRINITY_DN3266_c0_g1_i6.p1  ORF type:complete len:447 (+),score=55.56 TRINITY_DN3266_c0_g1_i6:1010-2350(+)
MVPPDNITIWLGGALDSDIIALGFQETDFNAWTLGLSDLLKPKGFQLIKGETMWNMALYVYARGDVYPHVESIHSRQKATMSGFAVSMMDGWLGNKGAVIITFKLFDNSFCFISSHLTARPENAHLRRENVFQIIKDVKLAYSRLETTFGFDFCFWMGDMNWRIDKEFEETVKVVESSKFKELEKFDQLTKYRNAGQLFTAFEEGNNFTFRPTYRRLLDRNDLFSNKKGQSPSWTDRVVYRAVKKEMITLLEYRSYEEMMGSDHKPVSAMFSARLNPMYTPDVPFYLSVADSPNTIIVLDLIEILYDIHTQKMFGEHVAVSNQGNLYLGFDADFLLTSATSARVKCNLLDKAVFNKQDLPLLFPAIPSLEFICTRSLFISIFQERDDGSSSLIGQCTFQLNQLSDEERTPHHISGCLFCEIELLSCAHFGIVKGKLQIANDWDNLK